MNYEELQTRVQCLTQKIKELLAHYKHQQEVIQHLQQENEQLKQQAICSLKYLQQKRLCDLPRSPS